MNKETVDDPVYWGGPRDGEVFRNPSYVLPPSIISLPPHRGRYVLWMQAEGKTRYSWMQDAN